MRDDFEEDQKNEKGRQRRKNEGTTFNKLKFVGCCVYCTSKTKKMLAPGSCMKQAYYLGRVPDSGRPHLLKRFYLTNNV